MACCPKCGCTVAVPASQGGAPVEREGVPTEEILRAMAMRRLVDHSTRTEVGTLVQIGSSSAYYVPLEIKPYMAGRIIRCNPSNDGSYFVGLYPSLPIPTSGERWHSNPDQWGDPVYQGGDAEPFWIDKDDAGKYLLIVAASALADITFHLEAPPRG